MAKAKKNETAAPATGAALDDYSSKALTRLTELVNLAITHDVQYDESYYTALAQTLNAGFSLEESGLIALRDSLDDLEVRIQIVIDLQKVNQDAVNLNLLTPAFKEEFARIFGQAVSYQIPIKEDLLHLKSIIESGEQVTPQQF